MRAINAINRLPLLLTFALFGGCATQAALQQPDDQNSEAATVNLQLGIGYIQAGRFDVAAEKLRKALEYDNNLAEAHNALAILYEETGEYRLADQEYQQAIQKDPKYLLARVNYGRFLCRIGKANEGEGQFLLAIANPELENPDVAYSGAGECARILSVPERAGRYFRKALEINPFNAGALWQLASLDYEQGDYLQAREFLQRYHKQTDYNPASLRLGIAIEKALGEQQLQREYERLLLTKFANSDEARRLTKSE